MTKEEPTMSDDEMDFRENLSPELLHSFQRAKQEEEERKTREETKEERKDEVKMKAKDETDVKESKGAKHEDKKAKHEEKYEEVKEERKSREETKEERNDEVKTNEKKAEGCRGGEARIWPEVAGARKAPEDEEGGGHEQRWEEEAGANAEKARGWEEGTNEKSWDDGGGG